MESSHKKQTIIDCSNSYSEVRNAIVDNIKECRSLQDQTSPEKKGVLHEYSKLLDNTYLGLDNTETNKLSLGEPIQTESPNNKRNDPKYAKIGNLQKINF